MRPGMKRVAYATVFTGLFGAAFAAAIGAIPPREKDPVVNGTQDLGALDRVSESCWSELRSKHIYFAHQSVGSNILTGMREVLQQCPSIALPITTYRDDSPSFALPGLVQGPAGANGSPQNKIDGFVELLSSARGDGVDIALLKLCYADIGKSTDAVALFRQYAHAMDTLQAKRPNMRIVHCTIPLRSPASGVKAQIKKLVGSGNDGVNAVRGRFNELMRARYKASVLFDVAQVESIKSDGSACTVSVSGRDWPALAAEYTDDGGHLNHAGQIVAARELLLTLSRQCDGAKTVAKPAIEITTVPVNDSAK